MTRINANIPPRLLTDWHLIAEVNEIPRVFEVYQYRIDNDMFFNDIPKQFTLGKGHVIFFLDKQKYLQSRYFNLRKEIDNRDLGKHVEIMHPVPSRSDHWRDYSFTEQETGKVVARIISRIRDSDKMPKYFGDTISKDTAIRMLEGFCKPTEDGQLKLL